MWWRQGRRSRISTHRSPEVETWSVKTVCSGIWKKNRTIFILITSKITNCMSNAFPKSIICRARLWRPEKKFFKSWKILPRMSIEDSCLEGRWPGSCPVSGRRGSDPSSAIDAQVPKSEKEMILPNEAQAKWLEDLGCEVKGKRFGDSLVLVCHVDQVEKRSQGGQFGHKNTSIGESETPWTLFTRFLVLEEKPGHSHVGRTKVWCGLVDPLGNLPQDVPLPVVGRTLHLGRIFYFLICVTTID